MKIEDLAIDIYNLILQESNGWSEKDTKDLDKEETKEDPYYNKIYDLLENSGVTFDE